MFSSTSSYSITLKRLSTKQILYPFLVLRDGTVKPQLNVNIEERIVVVYNTVL